jgi:hypothetical protein
VKKLIIILLAFANITPAVADQGGWVKVNANNQVVSGTIVCTPDVCGDANSPYSKGTLSAGERYVQVTKADTTGNVAGPNVVAPTAPNEVVVGTIDPVTEVMTVTRTVEEPFAPGVTVVRESEQKFSKNEPVVITNYKELVVKIQSVELLRENERFIEWIKTIRKILEKLYPDFVWPTE